MSHGPSSQDEHDNAVVFGGVASLVLLVLLVLLVIGMVAWILVYVLPMLADAAWFAIESVLFLAFQLLG